jgi:hypothetical protein
MSAAKPTAEEVAALIANSYGRCLLGSKDCRCLLGLIFKLSRQPI